MTTGTITGPLLGTSVEANSRVFTGDPTGTVDVRADLNTMIASLSSAGGGVVYLPPGTFLISGTGVASAGAIVLKDNITLRGSGLGVTTLKLKNSMGSDVTGLVRTPSGTSNSHITLQDLTIDGNKANNGANTIIGFYCGVTPSLGITSITVSGTTGTVVTTASHGLSSGATVSIFNTNAAALTGDFTITVTNATTFTITVAGGTGTEAASPAYIWYYPTSAANASDYDITCQNVEIKNCTDYGFDPHERVTRANFISCLSHDNGKDGFVADYQIATTYKNCRAYSNDRHGFNITTGSQDVSFINCYSYSNGTVSNGSGLVIQRGSANFPFPQRVRITGGSFHENNRNGILVQMGKEIAVTGITSYLNLWSGLQAVGMSYSTISGNIFKDNSQTANASKAEISIAEYDDSAGASGVKYASTRNIIKSNSIASTVTNKASYSILEAADTSTANTYDGNAVVGAATGDYSIGSSTSPLIVLPTLPRPKIGTTRVLSMNSYAAISTSTMSINIANFCPIYVERTTTFTSLVFTPTLATSVSYKVGIYSEKNGYPTGTPITGTTVTVSSVTVASATQQTATFSVAVTLTPGWYFLSIMSDTSSTVNAVSTNGGGSLLGYADTVTTGGPRFTKSQTYSNGLPDMTGVTPTITEAATTFFLGLTVQ